VATIYSAVACEQCHFPGAHCSFRTRDATVSVACPRCGFRYWTVALIDRQRQAVDPERRPIYKLDGDGNRIRRAYRRPGYGAYCLWDGRGGTLGAFTAPLSPEESAAFVARVRADPRIDPARSWATRWDGDAAVPFLGDPERDEAEHAGDAVLPVAEDAGDLPY
jgi:hypothetical protein